MKEQAIAQIQHEIENIQEEGSEDVAAWEWRAQLQTVLNELIADKITAQSALEELDLDC